MHDDGWSLISISTNLQISCYQPILIPGSLLEVQLAEANDPNAGFGFAAMFLNERGQGIRPSALWHRVSRRNPTCVPLFPQSTFIYFPWFSTGWYDKLNLFYYLIFPSLSSFICPFGSPMNYLLSSCVMNSLRSFHKATAPLPTPYETFSASLVPWPSWLWKDSAKRPSRDATSGSSALPFWFPQILAYL